MASSAPVYFVAVVDHNPHPYTATLPSTDGVPSDCDDAALRLFWTKCNHIAQQRDLLLASRPVNWDAVAESIIASNVMLQHAPHGSSRILARLAKLPLSWDPRQPARLIYVVYGPFPPYVGQTSCVNEPRSLLDCYRENLRRAHFLQKHSQGCRICRVRGLCSFGKLPCLTKVLAHEGVARVSILGLQLVPEHTHAGGPEGWWVHVLSPTLNQVLPFGGLDGMRWNSLLNRSHQSSQETSMKSLIQDIVNSHGRAFSADELPSFAIDCYNHVDISLFERFFHIVRRKVQAH